MSVRKLIFIRHCESDNNVILHNKDGSCIKKEDMDESQVREMMARDIDPDLSEKGKEQALYLADYLESKLKGVDPNTIEYHISPYRRTLQTANEFLDPDMGTSKVLKNITEWTPERKRAR